MASQADRRTHGATRRGTERMDAHLSAQISKRLQALVLQGAEAAEDAGPGLAGGRRRVDPVQLHLDDVAGAGAGHEERPVTGQAPPSRASTSSTCRPLGASALASPRTESAVSTTTRSPPATSASGSARGSKNQGGGAAGEAAHQPSAGPSALAASMKQAS